MKNKKQPHTQTNNKLLVSCILFHVYVCLPVSAFRTSCCTRRSRTTTEPPRWLRTGRTALRRLLHAVFWVFFLSVTSGRPSISDSDKWLLLRTCALGQNSESKIVEKSPWWKKTPFCMDSIILIENQIQHSPLWWIIIIMIIIMDNFCIELLFIRNELTDEACCQWALLSVQNH